MHALDPFLKYLRIWSHYSKQDILNGVQRTDWLIDWLTLTFNQYGVLVARHVLSQELDELRNTSTRHVHHALSVNLYEKHGRYVQRHRRISLLPQLISQRLSMVEHELSEQPQTMETTHWGRYKEWKQYIKTGLGVSAVQFIADCYFPLKTCAFRRMGTFHRYKLVKFTWNR